MGKILWLASYPRSGNTWLRAFLHNLLRNPDEPYDINRLQDFTLIDSDAPGTNRLPVLRAKSPLAESPSPMRSRTYGMRLA